MSGDKNIERAQKIVGQIDWGQFQALYDQTLREDSSSTADFIACLDGLFNDELTRRCMIARMGVEREARFRELNAPRIADAPGGG